MKTLNVYGLPQIFLNEGTMQSGDTAIAIDVLRATTTILHALCVGAKTVVPLLEVEETLALKKAILQGEDARFAGVTENELLLGGERQGTRIDGFDLGNSPLEYSPEKVAGKTILFSTTNGTKALCAATKIINAKNLRDTSVLPASFLNAEAVVDFVSQKRGNVHIICAGTDGRFTEEDLCLAGLLVEQLQRRSRNAFQMNVQAVSVLEQWQRLFPDQLFPKGRVSPETLAEYLHESRGGKNLHGIKMEKDIDFASRINSISTLAFLDPQNLLIQLQR